MFSQNLAGLIDEANNVGTTTPIGKREVRDLLEKSLQPDGLELPEMVELMNGVHLEENQKVILQFSADYKRPHDNKILLLPPLYFTSICNSFCDYCEFTMDGVRLDLDHFAEEVQALIDMGYRSIELVAAQDPKLFLRDKKYKWDDQYYNIEPVAAYFDVLNDKLNAHGGGMITSNIPVLDTPSFQRLNEAGLECWLVWLETFSPDIYDSLHHERVSKGNQAFRLDSFERSMKGGIEHYAGAFLKGLWDWRKEEVMLYAQDKHLRGLNGRGFSIIGSPRVKGQFLKTEASMPFRVSDEEYELCLALDRILFDGILWMQTRESFDFNRELMGRHGAGVVLTLTSSTAPGGYSRPITTHVQFPVFAQSLEDSVKALEDDGFECVFAWDANTLAEYQRPRAGVPVMA
jgi:2-iminoacetate synthase ThiH